MSNVATVSVDVLGRDVNLVALLTRLEGQMRQTDQVGIRLSQTTGGTFTAAQQRAANAAITEAQAMARAAVAVGDNARAHDILVNALGNSAAATDKGVASLTTSIGRLESGSGIAQQFGSSLKGSLLGIIGPAALATGAITAFRAVVGETEEAFKLKASLDTSRQSIDLLLRGVRDSGEVWAGAARFANQYKLTQQETTEAIQASVRIIRSSKAPIEDVLGAFARLKVLAPEKTFQDAARALSELQAGQVVSIEHLFNIPRREANLMKQEIEGGADAVTVLNSYLDRTGITMDAVAAQATGATGKLKEMAQSTEQFQLALAGASGGPGFAILQQRILVTDGLTRLLSGDFTTMGQAVNQSSLTAQGGLAILTGGLSSAATQAGALYSAIFPTTTAIIQNADASQFAASAATIAANAEAFRAGEHIAATQAVDASTQSLIEHIQQEQQSTIEGERLAQVQATLAQLGPAVAGGLQTAGSAAAFLATRYNIAYQEALKLISAQAQIAGAASGGAGVTEGRLERDTPADRAQVGANKAVEANRKLLQSIAATNKAHKAGGAVRLSDQQKLNNSLLSDQERYQQQSEDLDREHGKRLIEIEKDYQKKQQEQAKSNELSKREGELGFLKSITESELNATKEGRAEIKRINDQFYADFDAAQKAAQAGNLKQSEELVEQARKRAQVEQEYAEKIQAAKKDKNGDEVARLEALRKKERELLDEQQKQIVEGGDPNKVAKDAALTEEETRYKEQQDKLAIAAEDKGERAVNSAVREGKAVKGVNDLLDQQEEKLNRIAPLVPGGAGVAAPAAPAGGAPTTPTATGAAAPADPFDMLKTAIVDALAALQATDKDGVSRIVNAINGIGPRLSSN